MSGRGCRGGVRGFCSTSINVIESSSSLPRLCVCVYVYLECQWHTLSHSLSLSFHSTLPPAQQQPTHKTCNASTLEAQTKERNKSNITQTSDKKKKKYVSHLHHHIVPSSFSSSTSSPREQAAAPASIRSAFPWQGHEGRLPWWWWKQAKQRRRRSRRKRRRRRTCIITTTSVWLSGSALNNPRRQHTHTHTHKGHRTLFDRRHASIRHPPPPFHLRTCPSANLCVLLYSSHIICPQRIKVDCALFVWWYGSSL